MGRQDEPKWYIAITNPNCQRRAEAGLAAIGYGAFFPRLRKWVSHARTKVAKEYPVLGRYLFVEVPPDGSFWAVRAVNGIEAMVTYTNRDGDPEPISVPPEIVYAFRERYLRGEWDYVTNETGQFVGPDGETTSRRNRIPVGAIVRIMEGEFADMLAIVHNQQHGKLKLLPRGGGKFFWTWPDNARAA